MIATHTPTPWTDAAINALKSDAFNVPTTIWNELRRIESQNGMLNNPCAEVSANLVACLDARAVLVADLERCKAALRDLCTDAEKLPTPYRIHVARACGFACALLAELDKE